MENLNLNEKSLIYFLKQYRMKKSLRFFESTASTNDEAKKLCQSGKGRGVLIAADAQESGKGRQGRDFYSPKGKGIYFSAVYELNDGAKNLDLISSAAGLAVRDTLYNIFGLDVKIKWPNDILYDEKKLCGILCEAVNEGDRPKYIIIGIGVNLETCDFPDELSLTATSVGNIYSGEVELDHNEILIDIVNNLDRYIIRSGLIQDGDCSDIIARLKASSCTLGKMVRVITPDTEYDARALDIADNGGLVVQGPVEITTLTSGEVRHLR
ncbi:MAG: biotin--[acetyl-CoA-carboxylase] ligase [Ruminococcaceae bacterium]|nr:biotin--[acetyl-CoA-carboxylase] ligase [Oscillospiraceae bacterium]